MEQSSTPVIPPQQTGKQSDIIEQVVATDATQARNNFHVAAGRLLAINSWAAFSEGISATFALTDAAGKSKQEAPRPGDYIKIDIPGPSASAGNGYDWARVELVENKTSPGAAEEYIAMRVRPAAPPGQPGETAHFFDDAATSSFIIKRMNNIVTAEIHGRNEKANTDTEQVTDKIRNTLVSWGARAGLSGVQWTKLAKGLLNGLQQQ